MTIFMGIRTKDYVFTCIDSLASLVRNNQIVGTSPNERKVYWLQNYNIGIATIGDVIKGDPTGTGTGACPLNLDTALYITGIIDQYPINPAPPVQKIIDDITSMFKHQFSRTMSSQKESIIVIFGYNQDTQKTFLYDCWSPNFKANPNPENQPFFCGYDEDIYRKNSLKLYKKLKVLNKIDLKQWAHQTVSSNPNLAVDYPLVLNMYSVDGGQLTYYISEKDKKKKRSLRSLYTNRENPFWKKLKRLK